MTNVAITGITGFIGSYLAKKLVAEGFNVYGIIRPCASRNLEPIRDILDKVTLLTGEIASAQSVHHALKTINPDYIFHLAALSPVRYSFEHPFQYETINYQGTMNIVHAMLELPDYRKRRLLAASTAEVYGIQEEKPFTEELPLNPTSPYAVSKAAADMYLRMASRVYNLNCVVLRPTNSYGRKFEENFIVEYILTSILRNQSFSIGAPDSIRDFMYVDDHVEGYFAAMQSPKAEGKVYNLGTKQGVSNRELTRKIIKLFGADPKIANFGTYPRGYPMRPFTSDQPYLVLNPSKISHELNWRPHVSLDEGLQKTYKYWSGVISGEGSKKRDSFISIG